MRKYMIVSTPSCESLQFWGLQRIINELRQCQHATYSSRALVSNMSFREENLENCHEIWNRFLHHFPLPTSLRLTQLFCWFYAKADMERTAHRECPLNSGCGLQLLRMALLYLTQSTNVRQNHMWHTPWYFSQYDYLCHPQANTHLSIINSCLETVNSIWFIPILFKFPKLQLCLQFFQTRETREVQHPWSASIVVDIHLIVDTEWLVTGKWPQGRTWKISRKEWVQFTLIWDANKES